MQQHRVKHYEGDGYENGRGGAVPLAFPSNGIQLLSWMPLPTLSINATSANTVEGYVSGSGREYAVFGTSDGTVFVDLADPGSPRRVGFITGPTSLWRDLRTYQTYAYAVSEGGGGIQIFNLAQIDAEVVSLVGTVNTPGSASTHTVYVNKDSGFLYRCGGGSTLGVRIYSLANPAVPAFVANVLTGRYVHECQAVNYTSGPYAGREILFCYSNTTSGGGNPGIDILDVTNKAAVVPLSFITYPNAAFSHQGWLSADKQYVYLNDELDEQDFNLPTLTRVFNVSNLSAPVFVGTFGNGGTAVDHNLYVRGNLIFQGNYRSGLRIFDASVSQTNPTEVAFFDTWTEDDLPNFNGIWDNDPFLPSGIVLGADIEKGLFVWYVGAPQLTFDFPSGTPSQISPSGATLQVEILPNGGASVAPGSAKLLYNNGGAWSEVPLAPISGNLYEAALPALPCGTQLNYYVAARSNTNITWRNSTSAPTNTYPAVVTYAETVALNDEMETNTGWTVGAPGDAATTGLWVRVDPVGTAAQPEDDHTPAPGVNCWITGQGLPGGGLGDNDVDGGATTLTSPRLDASTGQGIALLQYHRWYSNNTGGAPNADSMPVLISNDDGVSWVQIELVTENAGAWVGKSFRIDQFVAPTALMRLRFVARDLNSGSIVEAGVDDVRIVFQRCTPLVDIDGDGDLDAADLAAFSAVLLGQPLDPAHVSRSDLNDDGVANGDDIQSMVQAYLIGG